VILPNVRALLGVPGIFICIAYSKIAYLPKKNSAKGEPAENAGTETSVWSRYRKRRYR